MYSSRVHIDPMRSHMYLSRIHMGRVLSHMYCSGFYIERAPFHMLVRKNHMLGSRLGGPFDPERSGEMLSLAPGA